MKTDKELQIFAAQIRKTALYGLSKLGAGHIGGSMSMADLMAVLYGGMMKIDPENPKWPERDWLVVSKGHCGPAVYAALALRGFFPVEEITTINQPGTRLPSHCDMNLTPGIDMSTGSLGQGMSTALGAAWGNRYQHRANYTYLVLGDGECEEGIESAKTVKDRPHMIVLQTEKGKDCTFAEGIFYNHHIKFMKEQYEEAVAALDQKIERLQREEV